MTTTISGTSGVSQPQVSVAAAINTPTAGLVTFTLNPCVLAFRNSTLSNGAVGTKTISSAITLATDNTGASFGATTAVQVRLYLLAIDDGTATPRLGVTLGSGLQLDETNVLASTTAITGAVTDGTKVYTTSALGAGAYPYNVVGVVDATWTTGSGWITTPALVQGCDYCIPYQDGTFTPSGWTGGGTGITYGTGVYTRVGRMVTYSVTINGTGLTGTASVSVLTSNLPWAPSTTYNASAMSSATTGLYGFQHYTDGKLYLLTSITSCSYIVISGTFCI